MEKIQNKQYKDYLQRFKPRHMVECPICKKQTVVWRMHGLICDHCGTYIDVEDIRNTTKIKIKNG